MVKAVRVKPKDEEETSGSQDEGENDEENGESGNNSENDDKGDDNEDDAGSQEDDDYQFSSLVNNDTDLITLTYQTHGDDDCDTLDDPNGDSVYYFKRPSDSTGEVWSSSTDHRVGLWEIHSWHSDKLKFTFSWTDGDWGFDPEKKSITLSTGAHDGKLIKWQQFGEYDTDDDEFAEAFDNFHDSEVKCTIKAFGDDESDDDDALVTFDMTTYSEGTLEIVKSVVNNQDQLDEVVTVAFAVMDRWRNDLETQVRRSKNRRKQTQGRRYARRYNN